MQITLINPPICLKDVYGKFEKLASFQPPLGITSLRDLLFKVAVWRSMGGYSNNSNSLLMV